MSKIYVIVKENKETGSVDLIQAYTKKHSAENDILLTQQRNKTPEDPSLSVKEVGLIGIPRGPLEFYHGPILDY